MPAAVAALLAASFVATFLRSVQLERLQRTAEISAVAPRHGRPMTETQLEAFVAAVAVAAAAVAIVGLGLAAAAVAAVATVAQAAFVVATIVAGPEHFQTIAVAVGAGVDSAATAAVQRADSTAV